MLLHLSHCCSKGASRTIKLCNFSKEDDVHHHVVRKPLNRGGNKLMIRAPKNQCPVTPCVLNHKRWLVALRKQCIEETKEETAECEHFWPREWRHPKNTRNGLLRDLGCPCWELPLLGWIPVQNKSLRVMNAESDLTKQFVTYYVLCIHTALFFWGIRDCTHQIYSVFLLGALELHGRTLSCPFPHIHCPQTLSRPRVPGFHSLPVPHGEIGQIHDTPGSPPYFIVLGGRQRCHLL